MSRPPRNSKVSKKEIGKRVRLFRDERGLTQTELGELLDLTQSNISAIERGDRGVTIHQAVRIARALRISVDELLTGSGPTKDKRSRTENRRFLRRLQQIDKLPKGDKQALLRTIDAFLSRIS